MTRFEFIATYIVTNKRNGTIDTGSTANLPERITHHKSGSGSVFTKKHECHQLVWYEQFGTMAEAIAKEKRIKSWPRKWKLNLIESVNPDWDELSTF